MEKKLRQLFDYQKFIRNIKLDAVLERATRLSDDDLSDVAAAGDLYSEKEKKNSEQ